MSKNKNYGQRKLTKLKIIPLLYKINRSQTDKNFTEKKKVENE